MDCFWVFGHFGRSRVPSGASSTIVKYTKAVLLKADGTLINADGTSPISFPDAPLGSYYIAVRYRNHLGFRTQNPIALSNISTTLDFTNNSIPLSITLNPLSATRSMMIAGDANYDGSIDAFDTINWDMQNGLYDNYSLNADYNLDGSVDAFDSIIWEMNNGKYEQLD